MMASGKCAGKARPERLMKIATVPSIPAFHPVGWSVGHWSGSGGVASCDQIKERSAGRCCSRRTRTA